MRLDGLAVVLGLLGFVVGRHPSAVDVGIDAAGALIAIVAVGIVRSRRS